MNRTALVALIIAAVVIIAGGLWFFLSPGPSTGGQQTGTSTPLFPEGGANSGNGQGNNLANTGTTVVSNDGGQPITTRDCLDDPGVIHGPYNTPGYDILVGTSDPSAPNPPYEIDYTARDQSFGIALYQEPLGQYRITAEQDLMTRLGISEADMCRLNYVIAAGPGVNDAYSGKNLGFSFCPGATPLPQ